MNGRERAIAAAGMGRDPARDNVPGYGAVGFSNDGNGAAAQAVAQAVQQDQDAIAAMEAERFLTRAVRARQMRAPYEVMMPGDSFLSRAVNKVISAYGQPVYNQGQIVGAIGPSRPPGLLGMAADFFDLRPQAYTGISEFDPFDVTRDQRLQRDGQQVVPAVDTPMGKTCPDGYEFDDTLQACIRVSPGLQPAPFTPMQYRLPETGLLDFPAANMGDTLI